MATEQRPRTCCTRPNTNCTRPSRQPGPTADRSASLSLRLRRAAPPTTVRPSTLESAARPAPRLAHFLHGRLIERSHEMRTADTGNLCVFLQEIDADRTPFRGRVACLFQPL